MNPFCDLTDQLVKKHQEFMEIQIKSYLGIETYERIKQNPRDIDCYLRPEDQVRLSEFTQHVDRKWWDWMESKVREAYASGSDNEHTVLSPQQATAPHPDT